MSDKFYDAIAVFEFYEYYAIARCLNRRFDEIANRLSQKLLAENIIAFHNFVDQASELSDYARA